MKKILSLAICAASVIVIFTGCSEKDEAFNYYPYTNMSQYITVKTYKGVEIPVDSAEIQDKITEKYHNDMKSFNLNGSNEMGEGTKVQNGDKLVIDFVGKMDGQTFEGGSDTDADLTVGSNTYIDGFESGLIGVELGKTVDLNLNFPDPYPLNPSYSGKPVVFTVTVKRIIRYTYPELGEEHLAMVQELGYQTIDEYKQAVFDSVKADYVWNTVILSEATVVDYPQNELNNNITFYQNLYQSIAQNYTEDSFNILVRQEAETRTKEELVAYDIAKKENITVSDDELNQRLEEVYGDEYTERQKSDVRNDLLVQKVKDFTVENSVEK